MDLEFLSQTDAATIRFELAKRHLEAAKSELEAAKQSYEAIFNKAEDHGFSKSKLKKLSDDRIAALFEAGIVQVDVGSSVATLPTVKPIRTKKAKKKIDSLASKQEPSSSDETFGSMETDSEAEPPSLDQ